MHLLSRCILFKHAPLKIVIHQCCLIIERLGVVSYYKTCEKHENRWREMRTSTQELALVLSPVIVGPCQIPKILLNSWGGLVHLTKQHTGNETCESLIEYSIFASTKNASIKGVRSFIK